ncbi:succinate dehydrogenase assembly factor 2 [Antarcticimicrobium luteum]|uniref:FAD assembly factor SdhE n=1 Tax=Antarcticimicrobium luteum TaxID=2547397 RepID=A0A4R5UPX7_9RHOB|nr:succinate dehydrogenase assembly factor 2 [Antarcticimicrobium luteum]TDK41013.1 succinate dehydrogenase assembly factor 2 [Antarcticimicrobium luteum]
MNETREIRIKRLKMRSMRRGIKEMDLILQAYAGRALEGMAPEAMDLYEALLNENDQDLYKWVTGQIETPAPYAGLVDEIAQSFQP